MSILLYNICMLILIISLSPLISNKIAGPECSPCLSYDFKSIPVHC